MEVPLVGVLSRSVYAKMSTPNCTGDTAPVLGADGLNGGGLREGEPVISSLVSEKIDEALRIVLFALFEAHVL
jgi:hypothetical protein